MDLVEVNVIHAEALEARLTAGDHVLAGEPDVVRPLLHREADLCRRAVPNRSWGASLRERGGVACAGRYTMRVARHGESRSWAGTRGRGEL